MNKVFITGGAGFVGSHIAHTFLEKNFEVYIYDTFKQYILPEPNAVQHNLLVRLTDIYDKVKIIQGDTLNKDYLRRSLMQANPDIIIHMAALPLASVAIEKSEEAFESILNSTVNIMEVMRDFQHPCRMVYASSSMVYGDFKTEKVTEESPKDPKDVYGSFKLCGEIVARGYMRRYDLDISIVRPSAVYGPHDANQRVLYKFIKRALNGEPLKVYGNGEMKLDFTYVKDLAMGIYLIGVHPKAAGETFNITRGKAESLHHAVEIIQKYIQNVTVHYGPVPDYVPIRGTLDVTKAKELLGYRPQYDLERGLADYINHLRIHNI